MGCNTLKHVSRYVCGPICLVHSSFDFAGRPCQASSMVLIALYLQVVETRVLLLKLIRRDSIGTEKFAQAFEHHHNLLHTCPPLSCSAAFFMNLPPHFSPVDTSTIHPKEPQKQRLNPLATTNAAQNLSLPGTHPAKLGPALCSSVQ